MVKTTLIINVLLYTAVSKVRLGSSADFNVEHKNNRTQLFLGLINYNITDKLTGENIHNWTL